MAIALRPADADPKVMLAEAYYRADDFQHAAAALKGVDVAQNALLINDYPTLNVAKLESFKGQTPYEVTGAGDDDDGDADQDRAFAVAAGADQRW